MVNYCARLNSALDVADVCHLCKRSCEVYKKKGEVDVGLLEFRGVD